MSERAAAPSDVAAGLAAFGLPGAGIPFPTEPLDEARWRTLLGHTRFQRLHGHLVDAIASGALAATDEQAAQAAQMHAGAMGQVLLLEQRLLALDERLGAAGIPYRVLKGPAVAHLDYPNPAMRVFADLDLLVPSAHYDAAVGILQAAGYRRDYPEFRPGFDRRFGKGATFTSGQGYQADLHRTFVMGPYGLMVDLDGLFQRSAPFRLAGRDLPALPAEERFLSACFHAALGDDPPRLVPLRDIAQQLLATGVDADRVLAVAERWGASAVVARAVGLAWDRLGVADVVPLTAWARRYERTRTDERLLRLYQAQVPYARKALASLQVIPGLAAKLAYLRALGFPQRAALVRRGKQHAGVLASGGRALLDREDPQ